MNTAQEIEHQRRSTPGMTQEKLSEKIGISAQTYRNKIKGRSSFKIEEVMTAVTAMGVSVEQLLDQNDDSSPPAQRMSR